MMRVWLLLLLLLRRRRSWRRIIRGLNGSRRTGRRLHQPRDRPWGEGLTLMEHVLLLELLLFKLLLMLKGPMEFLLLLMVWLVLLKLLLLLRYTD